MCYNVNERNRNGEQQQNDEKLAEVDQRRAEILSPYT